MAIVMGDLMLLIIVVAGVGGLVYRFSRKNDVKDFKLAQAAEETQRQKAAIDAKRFESGIPLVCLNCDTHFTGPLREFGCPMCHKSSLVVTDEELRNAANK